MVLDLFEFDRGTLGPLRNTEAVLLANGEPQAPAALPAGKGGEVGPRRLSQPAARNAMRTTRMRRHVQNFQVRRDTFRDCKADYSRTKSIMLRQVLLYSTQRRTKLGIRAISRFWRG